MNQQLNAGVAELADAPDLSSGAIWCEGSNPFSRTSSSRIRSKIICQCIVAETRVRNPGYPVVDLRCKFDSCHWHQMLV